MTRKTELRGQLAITKQKLVSAGYKINNLQAEVQGLRDFTPTPDRWVIIVAGTNFDPFKFYYDDAETAQREFELAEEALINDDVISFAPSTGQMVIRADQVLSVSLRTVPGKKTYHHPDTSGLDGGGWL